MTDELIKPYSEINVKTALNQMFEGMSLGPDGMTVEFYKHNWGVVSKDITSMALNTLNNGGFIHNINRTDITLIPKKKECTTLQTTFP